MKYSWNMLVKQVSMKPCYITAKYVDNRTRHDKHGEPDNLNVKPLL